MQEKLHDGGGNTDGWNGRLLEDQRTLACSLLIKCADISNVVCPYSCILTKLITLGTEIRYRTPMDDDFNR